MDTTTLLGVITLKSVYFKERKIDIQPAKDRRTNWFHGVPRLTEDQKKKLDYWIEPGTRMKVHDGMTLDLSDPIDKKNWDWMKHCQEIAMSLEDCQHSPKALFYVQSETREAQKSLDQDELLYKAMSYVMQDRTDMYEIRARLLGYNMEGENPLVIKEFLMQQAKGKQTYMKVITVYESNTIAIQMLFLKARDTNIIKIEKGVFMYGNTILGTTADAALSTLQDPTYRELAKEIEKEINPDLQKKVKV